MYRQLAVLLLHTNTSQFFLEMLLVLCTREKGIPLHLLGWVGWGGGGRGVWWRKRRGGRPGWAWLAGSMSQVRGSGLEHPCPVLEFPPPFCLPGGACPPTSVCSITSLQPPAWRDSQQQWGGMDQAFGCCNRSAF